MLYLDLKLIMNEKMEYMYKFTSFNEGTSKADNGTEDDIILALPSSLLA